MARGDGGRCATCGASPWSARPEHVGASQSSCPECGAVKTLWRKTVEVDNTLPMVAPPVRYSGPVWDAKRLREVDAEIAARRSSRERAQALRDEQSASLVELLTRLSANDRPVVRGRTKKLVNDRKVADALAKEAAWQDGYDRRSEAHRRLGIEALADEERVNEWGSNAANRAREVRMAMAGPRAELLAAARGGDSESVARCDELYVDWRSAVQHAG